MQNIETELILVSSFGIPMENFVCDRQTNGQKDLNCDLAGLVYFPGS